MRSIRTKTTFLTVCAVVVSLLVATVMGVAAVQNVGHRNSDELLLLMCETGQKNLNSYFRGVEQSVELASAYIEEDLNALPNLSTESVEDHVERVEDIFGRAANKTNGVLTYYYRLDPSISPSVDGFWFTNLNGGGFKEHAPTDITRYDTSDTSRLVWFTVPKDTGKPVWLPPYVTDNLDVRVISYNVPVYYHQQFVGVAGIEIDYTTMADQVNNIRLYDNGYAFINEADGAIVYHPHIGVEELAQNHPKVPQGLLSDSTHISYTFEGVERQAVWLPLENGMRLNVSVPIVEINAGWQRLVRDIIVVSAILLAVVIVITLRFTGRITRPLHELAEVAEQVSAGNYDYTLSYDGDDEVGVLTRAFNQLVSNLKAYIGDLNSRAYTDALTSVRNKAAFDTYKRDLQERIDNPNETPEFAVAIFDCDDLKGINDRHGHVKGDVYLKTSCQLICRVFVHSPVFRVGGDEFAAILFNDDYRNREDLLEEFERLSSETCTPEAKPWEQVRVSVGVAVFGAEGADSVEAMIKRADQRMYEDKRARKVARRA